MPGWPKFDPKDIGSIMGSRRYVRVRGYGILFLLSHLVITIGSHLFLGASLTFGNGESDTNISSNVASVKLIASLIFTTILKKKWSSMPAIFILEKERSFLIYIHVGRPPAAVRGHHDVARCEVCNGPDGPCTKLTGTNSESENYSNDSVKELSATADTKKRPDMEGYRYQSSLQFTQADVAPPINSQSGAYYLCEIDTDDAVQFSDGYDSQQCSQSSAGLHGDSPDP